MYRKPLFGNNYTIPYTYCCGLCTEEIFRHQWIDLLNSKGFSINVFIFANLKRPLISFKNCSQCPAKWQISELFVWDSMASVSTTHRHTSKLRRPSQSSLIEDFPCHLVCFVVQSNPFSVTRERAIFSSGHLSTRHGGVFGSPVENTRKCEL